MFPPPRLAPVALLLLASVNLTTAQTTEKRSTAAVKSAEPKSAALTEEERKAKARRAAARSLLIALSTDARSFNDQTLRARSLARIADALWQGDAGQGRLLFRKAWAGAEG